MSSDSRDPNEPGKDSSQSAEEGMLRVEVPHWTAEVRVYDNMYRPVAGIGPVKEDSDHAETYVVETKLPAGVYEVEVVLEAKSQREWVSIRPSRAVVLPKKKWKGLKFTSAAPLENTYTTDPLHSRHAIKWSKEPTTSQTSPGNSCLFLFVRTLDAKPSKGFAEGLSLLDGNGKLVTDFSKDVKKSLYEGWMAYHNNLPPGYYILRRGRSGVRLRHQPLYLCADWQTQVFLPAGGQPSLSRMTMNMSRRHEGFTPDSDTAVAAEAVLDYLRFGESGAPLIKSEKLYKLLKGKFENPWLGIIAAYALLNYKEAMKYSPEEHWDEEIPQLLKQVVRFLKTIKDHPDVRALNLDMEKSADAFEHPPILRSGLKRVQQHATKFANTITPGSLTDCVLEAVVTNSPWTAWRQLNRVPVAWAGPKAEASSRRKSASVRAAQATETTAVVSFLQNATPKAPIFQLAQTQEASLLESAPPDERTAQGPEFKINLISPEHAPLIAAAQEVTQSGRLEDLPDTLALGDYNLEQMLGKVNPEEFSAASGVPLAHAENSLESLLQTAGQSQSAGGAAEEKASLNNAQQSMLQYVIYKSEAPADKTGDAPEGGMFEAVADEPSEAVQRITIEECVNKLREEARRLMFVSQDGRGEAAGGAGAPGGESSDSPPTKKDVEVAHTTARRLQKAADRLLRCATFTVITDSDNRMLYGNGAFVMLLASAGDDKQECEKAQRMWEEALAGVSIGGSTLTKPAMKGVSRSWELHRMALQAEDGKSVRAYLNAFRSAGATYIPAEIFQQLESLLSELTLYASFFAHGSAERRSEYADKVKSITREIEKTIRAGEKDDTLAAATPAV